MARITLNLLVALLTFLSPTLATTPPSADNEQVPFSSADRPPQLNTSTAIRKVAVIGAGIAGSAGAFHINGLSDYVRFNVTVFERETEAGGQIRSIGIHSRSQTAELGAAAFAEDDWCVQDVMGNVGLRSQDPERSFDYDRKRVGVWDGRYFVLIEDDKSTFHGPWWRFLGWVWRYGFSPYRLHSASQKYMRKLHDLGTWTSSTVKLRQAVHGDGLDHLSQESAVQYFSEKSGISPAFVDQVLRPAVRRRFGQDLRQVSALSALAAMRAARALSVVGGNWLLPHRMLLLSEASLRLGSQVSRIGLGQQRRWEVGYSGEAHNHEFNITSEEFDIVILTAPLQGSGIEIIGPPRARQSDVLTHYFERHITHFATDRRLSPPAFGQHPNITLPEDILTSPNSPVTAQQDVFSITAPQQILPADPGDNLSYDEFLYRIESTRAMADAEVARLLGFDDWGNRSDSKLEDVGVTWVHRQKWAHAHPEFTAGHLLLENLEIAPGLYYTAAVHEVVSSMEMGCRAARNVVDHLWSGHT